MNNLEYSDIKNKSRNSNLNNTSNLNFDNKQDNSKNLILNNFPNLVNKDDNLSPIPNKNISEFLSNNKLITTDLKSNKKNRYINTNEDIKLGEVTSSNKIRLNNYEINSIKEEDNLETPKNKKVKSNISKNKEDQKKINYKINNNNNKKQDKLFNKIESNNISKNTLNTNSKNNITKNNNYNIDTNNNQNLNMININNMNNTNTNLTNFNSLKSDSEAFAYENELPFNSERNKQGNKSNDKVVFTLSKINEPINNMNYMPSKAFEFIDSNDFENSKFKSITKNNLSGNSENEEIKKKFNFQNFYFTANNQDESTKKIISKLNTNVYTSNDKYDNNSNDNDDNTNNINNCNDGMINMKTESDELNQSNDLKDKITEINTSMKLRKSGSLNFNLGQNKKSIIKGILKKIACTLYLFINLLIYLFIVILIKIIIY